MLTVRSQGIHRRECLVSVLRLDLMLAITKDGNHDVIWSDNLLDERERVIVRENVICIVCTFVDT
jgi:hypothetical protein